MITEILQLLAQGTTLVTPTNRLARYLQYQYASELINQGRNTWETPDILSWAGWLKRSWEKLVIQNNSNLVLLSAQQQQHIWQELIGSSSYAGQILNHSITAKQAIQAWNLCRLWQIPVFPKDTYLNEDAQAFKGWSESYQKRCKEEGWIDDSSLADYLINSTGNFLPDHEVSFVGFDEMTPQMKRLIEVYSESGCVLRIIPFPERNKHSIAIGFKDSRQEIRSAAIWAREILESGTQQSIGIVVQNLKVLHSRIENIFDDVLMPDSILVNSDIQRRPYSISLGLPLNSYPLIDIALGILDIGNRPLPLEDTSKLLRSPYIKDAFYEDQKRAKLDACLHQRGEHRMSIDNMEFIGRHNLLAEDFPESFFNSCKEYLGILQKTGKRQSANDWARTFSALLNVFGWPGERALNSAEFQTVAEWQSAIGKFASLDLVASALSWTEALSELRQLIMNTGFQPETPEVPIQVLGMIGVAGMQFDHLWIMGLHEEVWPARTEPEPFIPVTLQWSAGIIKSSAELALSNAELFTNRMIHSAVNVVLSHPQYDKDRPLRPSPLIKPYLKNGIKLIQDAPKTYSKIIFNSKNMEILEDNQASAIKKDKQVRGGSGLFKEQAACPFRAFSRYRLYATGLDHKDIGLNNLDRGSIVHDVMEKIWCTLKNHETLCSKTEGELLKLVDKTVRTTVTTYQKKYPFTFSGSFTRLETERLIHLVMEWLNLELDRQPFSIKACEYIHKFDFNGIEISTRIDRVDELRDGRHVIIDYKTGKPKITEWLSFRPDEPQLPLYAITSDGEIAAVAFAKLKQGELAWIGLSVEEDILPGVNTVDGTREIKNLFQDWDSLLSQWEQTLGQLATDFRNGNAMVDPKKQPDTCIHCDLHAFCRINEKLISGQMITNDK